MTRDEIIHLARKVILIDGSGACSHEPNHSIIPTLERFVALIEFEFRGIVTAAIAEEREDCALVCTARYMGDNNREDMEAIRCAETIRSRK